MQVETDDNQKYCIIWFRRGGPFDALFPSQGKLAYVDLIRKYTLEDDKEGMGYFFGDGTTPIDPSFTIELATLRSPDPPQSMQCGVNVSRIVEF